MLDEATGGCARQPFAASGRLQYGAIHFIIVKGHFIDGGIHFKKYTGVVDFAIGAAVEIGRARAPTGNHGVRAGAHIHIALAGECSRQVGLRRIQGRITRLDARVVESNRAASDARSGIGVKANIHTAPTSWFIVCAAHIGRHAGRLTDVVLAVVVASHVIERTIHSLPHRLDDPEAARLQFLLEARDTCPAP